MMGDTKLASAGDDIKLWDCEGFIYIRQFNPHAHNISSLCWSSDNQILASTSTGGDKIVLSYSSSGTHTREIGEGENYTCVSFNQSSRYVLGGRSDGLVSVWDLKTDKLKKTYKEHRGAVTDVQFNWNDTYIASASELGEIILYNVVTGIGCAPMVAPKVQAVRRLQYSNFRKSLLGAVSDDGAVSLWDTNTHRLVHSFSSSHKAPATGLAFSPVNEMLLLSVGLDKRIVCYDVQGKSAVKTMTAESPLTSVAMMPNGTTLAVGSTRGKVIIYDLRQGATPIQVLSGHKSSVQCLAFQHSGNTKGEVGGKASAKQLHGAKNSGSSLASRPKSQPNFSSQLRPDAYSQGLTDRTNLEHTPGALLDGKKPVVDCFSPLQDNGIFSPLINNTTGSSRGHSSAFSQPSPLVSKNVSHNSMVPEQNYSLPTAGKTPRSSSLDSKENNITGRRQRSVSPHLPDRASRAVQNGPVSGSPALRGPTPHARQSPSYQPRSAWQDPHTAGTPASPASNSLDWSRKSVSPRDRTRSSPAVTTSKLAANTDTSVAGAAAAPSGGEEVVGLQPFHAQFIRNLVEESLESFREQIRSDILNLQMEMLRQFIIQQGEIEALMKRHSINEELLAEVERLREENRELKKKF